MFHGNRWAAAFVALADGNPEAFACLKALVPAVKAMPGALFGRPASRRLEKLLAESADAAGVAQPAAKYAIRFISLLVEKNLFKHIDSIVQKIENLFDQQNGILAVTAESAVPLDSALEETLKRRLREYSGAAEVTLRSRLVPELLGGYRLRFGGYYIDASLKGQIESMKAGLEAAALAPVQGI